MAQQQSPERSASDRSPPPAAGASNASGAASSDGIDRIINADQDAPDTPRANIITNKIQELKRLKLEATERKAALSKDLTNSQKRRRRITKRAGTLNHEDLSQLMMIRRATDTSVAAMNPVQTLESTSAEAAALEDVPIVAITETLACRSRDETEDGEAEEEK